MTPTAIPTLPSTPHAGNLFPTSHLGIPTSSSAPDLRPVVDQGDGSTHLGPCVGAQGIPARPPSKQMGGSGGASPPCLVGHHNKGPHRGPQQDWWVSRGPSYIQSCDTGSWHLDLVRKSTGEAWKSPYRCRSWRHAGACRNLRASRDGNRIAQGLRTHGGPFAYMVLTVPQAQSPTARRDAYLGLFPRFKRLIKRLRRLYGETHYVAVIEQHKSGWPHLNVIVTGALAEACQGDGWHRERGRVVIPMAKAVGFGRILWLEPVRREEAISRYVVKLGGEVLAGEASKSTQVPIVAPRHFRRLRASRGFLPPVPNDPDITGELVKHPLPVVEPEIDVSPLVSVDCAVAAHRNAVARRRRDACAGEGSGVPRSPEARGPPVAHCHPYRRPSDWP